MRQKLSAFILIILPFVIAGCGDEKGAAGGTWIAEVYTDPYTSKPIGEYDSYVDCAAAIREESGPGTYNCGISSRHSGHDHGHDH